MGNTILVQHFECLCNLQDNQCCLFFIKSPSFDVIQGIPQRTTLTILHQVVNIVGVLEYLKNLEDVIVLQFHQFFIDVTFLLEFLCSHVFFQDMSQCLVS